MSFSWNHGHVNMIRGMAARGMTAAVIAEALSRITGHQVTRNMVIGKAGRARWLGRRPRTRGVAMSHHQHPHGGGEGRSKGGQEPSNASGTQSKGGRTRRFGLSTDNLIIRRRKSRRYGQLKL